MELNVDRTAWTPGHHPHLYEINTWAWLEDLSLRYARPVTLGSVPEEEWDRLRFLGFDLVWLMGVWKRSAEGRRIFRTNVNMFPLYDAALPAWSLDDVTGSPYSIQDYAPDPRIGSWSDLDAARAKLHERHIGLILDFVPNHTGPDHPWVQSHPEYYVQGTLAEFRKNPEAFFLAEADRSARFIAHGKDPYFPPWPDTAQLNYYNPELRSAMIDVLRSVAKHADGVRCDMAMLCQNDIFTRNWKSLLSRSKPPSEEFWTLAFAAVPGFVWIAEVYWDLELQLQELGFDFTYDKGFYGRLRDSSPRDVRQYLEASASSGHRMVRFLENHDEVRALSAFGKDHLYAAATIMATLPGLRFYHDGQLEGKRLHMPIQLRRAVAEQPDREVSALYAKLLQISRDPVFHQPDWKLLEINPDGDTSSGNLIAYRWKAGREFRVVVVNLGATAAQGRIFLHEELEASRRYSFHDLLDGSEYERAGKDLIENGLFVRREGYQAHLFAVSTLN